MRTFRRRARAGREFLDAPRRCSHWLPGDCRRRTLSGCCRVDTPGVQDTQGAGRDLRIAGAVACATFALRPTSSANAAKPGGWPIAVRWVVKQRCQALNPGGGELRFHRWDVSWARQIGGGPSQWRKDDASCRDSSGDHRVSGVDRGLRGIRGHGSGTGCRCQGVQGAHSGGCAAARASGVSGGTEAVGTWVRERRGRTGKRSGLDQHLATPRQVGRRDPARAGSLRGAGRLDSMTFLGVVPP